MPLGSLFVAEHQQGGIALGRPIGGGRHRLDDQRVAILDQDVAEIRQTRFAVMGAPVQLRIGIGGRRMRLVGAPLPAKVLRRRRRWPVFGLTTLVPRPRLHQRSVHREVLIRHGTRLLDDPAKVKADYFASGDTFDGWCLVPEERIMTYRRFLVFAEESGRMAVCVINDTGFADAVIWARNEAHLAQLKVQYEVPAGAPTVKFARANSS